MPSLLGLLVHFNARSRSADEKDSEAARRAARRRLHGDVSMETRHELAAGGTRPPVPVLGHR